jgi:hypothetical protein
MSATRNETGESVHATDSDRLIERGLIGLGGLLLVAYVLGTGLIFPKPDRRIVFGDATHHFVQLRSIVFDRDLHFRNEYVRLYGLRGDEPDTEWIVSEVTPTGHVRNYMPIGPSLLWAPLYLAVTAVLLVSSSLGLVPPPTGYEWGLQLTPGITGVAAATAASIIGWRTARSFADRSSTTIAVVAIWLGSHALYYSLVSPAYSHAPSMLTAAFFFAHWLRTRDEPSVGHLAQAGALAGLAALMRWQDALFLIVPVIETLRWRTSWPRRLQALALTAAAALAVFTPQMAVWTVLYGTPLAMPQGPSFMQWTAPHLAAVLFSDNHGLFTWAPLLLFAVAGLVSFSATRPGLALPIAAVLLAAWYVNAAVADWWAGEAFGARRFLSLTPLFSLGLAHWLGAGTGRRPRPGRTAVAMGLVLGNGLLLLQYQLFMKGLTELSPYPHGWFDMWLVRFVVPFRLLAWWAA